MCPLYQYAGQYPPVTSCFASIGPRSKYAISTGFAESGKSNPDRPPWYHACTMMSRPGTGMSDPLCATQFSCSVCGAGILKYPLNCSFLLTMSKIASAPHDGGSEARHRGRVPPPHSSVKITLVPSLLNVAECQKAKFLSTAWSS